MRRKNRHPRGIRVERDAEFEYDEGPYVRKAEDLGDRLWSLVKFVIFGYFGYVLAIAVLCAIATYDKW